MLRHGDDIDIPAAHEKLLYNAVDAAVHLDMEVIRSKNVRDLCKQLRLHNNGSENYLLRVNVERKIRFYDLKFSHFGQFLRSYVYCSSVTCTLNFAETPL